MTSKLICPISGVRHPTRAEYIADAVVHALGIGVGIVGAVALIIVAIVRGEPLAITSVAIYAAGLLMMLSCSAAYNVFRKSRHRALLRRLDHSAIFVMIAGTYTPFTVIGLDGAWAVGLTATIWGAATLGVIGKLVRPNWPDASTIVLYIAMGWVGVLAIDPLMESLGATTLILIAAGGLLYTIGVVFHVWERLPFQNAVWHGFVLAAAVVHYVAVLDGVVLRA